ncbi:MAG: FHA domain-containing protein [Synechococcaceae cyanobacterium SM2_3_60]|nr:FHA domain-containing protein [Synechococcaceae cyanobacterium SM2_3_60]
MGWFLLIQDSVGERGLGLSQARYTIGRSRQSDIRLFNAYASRKHAVLTRVELSRDEPHYLLADAALSDTPSANGLFLNTWRRVGVCSLQQGDVIHFGPQACAKIIDAASLSSARKQQLEAAFARAQQLPRLHADQETFMSALEPADQASQFQRRYADLDSLADRPLTELSVLQAPQGI